MEATIKDVEDIDVWVGGLAENHVKDASVGELVRTVLIDQFERLRDGDRFWYQNVFSGDRLRKIEQTSLADVIQRNTDIADLQDNIFFMPDQQPRGRGGAEHCKASWLISPSPPLAPDTHPATGNKTGAAKSSGGRPPARQDTSPQPTLATLWQSAEPIVKKLIGDVVDDHELDASADQEGHAGVLVIGSIANALDKS